MMGMRLPVFLKASSAAWSAALAFSVSKMVSSSSKSAPASVTAMICSEYAAWSVSKSMARLAGSSISGEREAVLLVGPMEAATNLGRSGVFAVILAASSRAIRTAARLISLARCSQP